VDLTVHAGAVGRGSGDQRDGAAGGGGRRGRELAGGGADQLHGVSIARVPATASAILSPRLALKEPWVK
jgi:hypothetical protein